MQWNTAQPVQGLAARLHDPPWLWPASNPIAQRIDITSRARGSQLINATGLLALNVLGAGLQDDRTESLSAALQIRVVAIVILINWALLDSMAFPHRIAHGAEFYDDDLCRIPGAASASSTSDWCCNVIQVLNIMRRVPTSQKTKKKTSNPELSPPPTFPAQTRALVYQKRIRWVAG
jgi:hypothetical protein